MPRLRKAECINAPKCEWTVGKGCKCTTPGAPAKAKTPSPKPKEKSNSPEKTEDPFVAYGKAHKAVYSMIHSIKNRSDVNNVAAKIQNARLPYELASTLFDELETTANKKQIHYDS